MLRDAIASEDFPAALAAARVIGHLKGPDAIRAGSTDYDTIVQVVEGVFGAGSGTPGKGRGLKTSTGTEGALAINAMRQRAAR